MNAATLNDFSIRPATTVERGGPALLIGDVAAATLLGISRAHVHRLRAAGKFPHGVKLGRSLRFNRDELTAWAAAGCPDLPTWKSMKDQLGARNRN